MGPKQPWPTATEHTPINSASTFELTPCPSTSAMLENGAIQRFPPSTSSSTATMLTTLHSSGRLDRSSRSHPNESGVASCCENVCVKWRRTPTSFRRCLLFTIGVTAVLVPVSWLIAIYALKADPSWLYGVKSSSHESGIPASRRELFGGLNVTVTTPPGFGKGK